MGHQNAADPTTAVFFPFTSFLKGLRLLEFRQQLNLLGVYTMPDFKWLTLEDLRGIGMGEAQSKSLIEAARTIPEGREHQPFTPKVNSPVSSILHHLRLQKLKDRIIAKLSVKTQEDLERLSDKDLKSIGVKALHRRRFLAGVAKLPKRGAYSSRARKRKS